MEADPSSEDEEWEDDNEEYEEYEEYDDGEEEAQERRIPEKEQAAQSSGSIEAKMATSPPSRPLLGTTIPKEQALQLQDDATKEARHTLRRTVSGVSLTGAKEGTESDRPKDLRQLLRRTQSGVSLTGQEEDRKQDTIAARPQLRGPTAHVAKPDPERKEKVQLRPTPTTTTSDSSNNNNNEKPKDLRLLLRRTVSTISLTDSHEPQEDTSPDLLLRRNSAGGANEGGGEDKKKGGETKKEDDKKKDPRLQFRRTVSAPALNALIIPKSRKRLVRCIGKKRVHVREVDINASCLNNNDVYKL